MGSKFVWMLFYVQDLVSPYVIIVFNMMMKLHKNDAVMLSIYLNDFHCTFFGKWWEKINNQYYITCILSMWRKLEVLKVRDMILCVVTSNRGKIDM